MIKELLTNIDDFFEKGNKPDYDELADHVKLMEKVNARIHNLLLTTRTKKIMKDFGERESDIYVVTFPKSGTTLMQMVLYQMTTDGNMDFNHLYDVSPWCRHSAFVNQEIPALTDPRIIKTHDEYALLRNIKRGKFIFVVRDCLDVISSFHAHIKNYNNPSSDFNELSDRKMKEWYDYNTEWIRNENDLEILYIHYEDLIADKKQVILKIAEFLGLEMNDEIVKRVLERSSFEFMKRHETKFGEQPEQWKVYNNFIRKGKIGEGRARFTPEQLEKYETLLRKQADENSFLRRYAEPARS